MGHVGSELDRAAYCVQPDLDPRGRSFDLSANGSMSREQLKWRTSFRREPGQRFIHAGLVDAPVPPLSYRHGIRTQGGDRAGDVFVSAQGGAESDLSSFHNLQKESIYRSSIREPLGSGYIRGHQVNQPNQPNERTKQRDAANGQSSLECYTVCSLCSSLFSLCFAFSFAFVQFPACVHESDFRFGASSRTSENAKSVIYHPTAAPHLRSHGSLDTAAINESAEDYARTLRNTTTNRAANEGAAQTMARTGSAAFAPSASASFGRSSVSAGGVGSGSGAGGFDPHHQERLVTRPMNREYNWASSGIDPLAHRFGKVSSSANANANPAANFESGVASALNYGADARPTNIGSKRVEECKSASFDHLGKGRRQRGELLAGDPRDPASSAGADSLNYTGHRSRTFGRPGAHDEWGARDCIKGAYDARQQMPDADLGRSSSKITALAHIPPEHEGRSFGLPSIRSDRMPPRLKSVANDINFGDESSGKGLLYPSQHAGEGVNEEDFLRQRSPAEIRSLFQTLGLSMPDAQFQRVATLAVRRYGALSVDAFRHAWNQVRLELVCETCGEALCQHEDCAAQPCTHLPGLANHARQARHSKQSAAAAAAPAAPHNHIQAAGFSSNTHPAM